MKNINQYQSPTSLKSGGYVHYVDRNRVLSTHSVL